ncbi:hypothetical protein [Adhaeribacter aquaticus]|uniref:hypothetical protein n=1 Tax=Adhaeribacter aquaticus TaxID=299567 RepID=UPI000419463D|nr:hypothetical protein [Adhaeribacter aquaticus]
MKNPAFHFTLCSVLVLCSFLSFKLNPNTKATEPEQPNSPKALSQQQLLDRGKYLVTAVGCNDCHSPKVMGPRGPELDATRLLSGHPANLPLPAIPKEATKDWLLFNQNLTAFVGPWGVSYAANITSDPTGIGTWTEEQFFTAIRKGKYKGLENNRPILPPMPWEQFATFTDDDLRAIFTFLKSTKPVKNVVPAAIPPDMVSKQSVPTNTR